MTLQFQCKKLSRFLTLNWIRAICNSTNNLLWFFHQLIQLFLLFSCLEVNALLTSGSFKVTWKRKGKKNEKKKKKGKDEPNPFQFESFYCWSVCDLCRSRLCIPFECLWGQNCLERVFGCLMDWAFGQKTARASDVFQLDWCVSWKTQNTVSLLF